MLWKGHMLTRQRLYKQGDAMLKPYNAVMGSKVISTTPAELLVIACPDELIEKLKSS
jgi:hypothetical protein